MWAAPRPQCRPSRLSQPTERRAEDEPPPEKFLARRQCARMSRRRSRYGPSNGKGSDSWCLRPDSLEMEVFWISLINDRFLCATHQLFPDGAIVAIMDVSIPGAELGVVRRFHCGCAHDIRLIEV